MSAWTRIARGSARILGRLVRRLLAAGERDGDRIGPILLIIIASAALWYVLERSPILGGPLTIGWLAAAWRAGAPADTVDADEEEPDEDTGPPLPDVNALAQALHTIGTPHAHVAALAEHLKVTAEVARAALTEAGIPTEPCRMKGRGSSTGVKAEHFPPLPSPTSEPSETVVAAGQANNNNAKRVTRWAWGHTVTDPTEALHHDVAKTPARSTR